jgi:hypothetical protein
MNGGRERTKKSGDRTYADVCSLNEEADDVETQLAIRCEGNSRRDHEDDDGQFAVGFLDPEGPRDKEDDNGGERLDICSVSGRLKSAEGKGYLPF